jgi:hypothetical protein
MERRKEGKRETKSKEPQKKQNTEATRVCPNWQMVTSVGTKRKNQHITRELLRRTRVNKVDAQTFWPIFGYEVVLSLLTLMDAGSCCHWCWCSCCCYVAIAVAAVENENDMGVIPLKQSLTPVQLQPVRLHHHYPRQPDLWRRMTAAFFGGV